MALDDIQGRFLWYELLTTAPEAAKPFYSQVVGWGTDLWEGAGVPYTMWTVGQSPVGGVMQLPDEAVQQGARPHWLAHIGSRDVDASANRAEKLGAKILNRMEIPQVGRIAIVSDPQGAMFALHSLNPARNG